MAKRRNGNFDDFGDDFGGSSSYGDSGNRGLFWFKNVGEAWSFTQWACAMALIGVPMGVAFVWGIYNENNLAGVIGIAGRRAGGALVQETQPVGESLLNGTSGKGFRPGKAGADDTQRLNPGGQR